MVVWTNKKRKAFPLSQVAGTLSLRIQQLNVSCETKTKDNVFVRVEVAVRLTDNTSACCGCVDGRVPSTVPLWLPGAPHTCPIYYTVSL